jgi:hypothetical protein
MPEGMLAIIRVEHQGRYYGDANAHLIAAAPDMFDALTDVREWLMVPFNAKDADDENLHPSFRKALRTVNAALAKARGETP